MKNSIEFSIFLDDKQETEMVNNLLKSASFRFDCSLHVLQWEEEWEKILRWALYKDGPDLSQVGAPLVGDLVGMNALRPFTGQEINKMGGQNAFYPVIWGASARVFENQVFAVPFFSDAYVILYWRDLLQQAGVDENTAFRSAGQLEETLQRLQAKGMAAPFVHITDNGLNELKHAASWIWEKGGDFMERDCRATAFAQAEARAGLKAYFGLYRYMPQTNSLITAGEAANRFVNRQAAVILYNFAPSMTDMIQRTHPELAPHLGLALPPGPALIGCSDLVVWASSHYPEEDIELVNFLTSEAIQAQYCRARFVLPSRKGVLSLPAFRDLPFASEFDQALQTGRSFPAIPQSGMLENRLSAAIRSIWSELAASPHQDQDALLSRILEPLAWRIDNVLKEFHR